MKLLLALTLLAVCDASLAQKDPLRLPGIQTPISYQISLTLKPKTFHGSATIRLKTASEPFWNKIVLHSRNLAYDPSKITLKKVGNPEDLFLGVEFDSQYEFMIVRTKKILEGAAEYELRFDNYEGQYGDDLYGIYLSSYKDERNSTQSVIATQFHPTHARRAFPCFDEPNLKATFDITINHPKEYTTVLSNAGIKQPRAETGDYAVTRFLPTKKMSTYLVAFVVSQFSGMQNEERNYTVYARDEAKSTLGYSLEKGQAFLTEMGSYLRSPYNKHLDKLEQVAIPDFAAGAMENWGLVLYRESRFLLDEKSKSKLYEQTVACTIAHELSHQWFGDLVTMDWWSSSWLNEGFARYFEYMITAKVMKTWELEKQFVVEVLQDVLKVDSLESSSALTSDASIPAEIQTKFDSITYDKGASIIRMMSHLGGFFIVGLQEYVGNYELGNVRPEHLMKALQRHIPNVPNLAQKMENWLQKPGYPVVNVTLNADGTVTLTQERFLFRDEDTTRWDIPISYTTSIVPSFKDADAKLWFLAKKNSILIPNLKISDEDWIVLNIQSTGYYRVNYDPVLRKNLRKALRTHNFGRIIDINRAQIVDDALNLARAGKIGYDEAFHLISFLEEDESYYPWYSAIDGFTYLWRRIDKENFLGKAFTDHVLRLSQTVAGSGGNGHIDILRRSMLSELRCKLGNPVCIRNALDDFDRYYLTGAEIDPNLRSVVYCTAIREAEGQMQTKYWQFLWNKFEETKWIPEQVNILTGLGCTRRDVLLQEFLHKSIGPDSIIKRQDADLVFTSVVQGSPIGPEVAFKFLRNNLKDIIKSYGRMNALGKIITSLAETFTNERQIKELENFYADNMVDLEKAGNAVENAIENARANLEIGHRLEKELISFLFPSSSTAVEVNLVLLLAGCVLSNFLFK